MRAINTLVVQPWFTAIGHPAQSTLNLARALGRRDDFAYLVSNPAGGTFEQMCVELERCAAVRRFSVPNDSLRLCTLLSLPALARWARRLPELERVLFLDANLAVVAAMWPIFFPRLHLIHSASIVYLGGPERICSNALVRLTVSRFLASALKRLYLRTEELADAWRLAFPEIPHNRIDTLPSLEIPEPRFAPRRVPDGTLRIGLIGQIRPGKSIEWLIPMFELNPELGMLTIAGTFTNAAHRSQLRVLDRHKAFENRYLTEAEMISAAGNQDYLVALYDDWDTRMEAATVFLAARVGRPVIVYDEGWPGRIVREFGCGVAISRTPRPDEKFFASLPRPGNATYEAYLVGAERFCQSHGGAQSRDAFLAKLLGEPA